MNDAALVPIEEKTVLFYDDEITAVVVDHNSHRVVYVPLRPLCDYLGIDWSAQRQRINRDLVLAKYISGVVVTPTPTSKYTNPQEMICLPLDYLNGWLFGINASRVKEEIRDRLVRYQEECYRVLADAFMKPAVTPSMSALEQVRQMGIAITRMAEEQMEFERRLTTTEGRLDQAASVVGDLSKRMIALEETLTDSGRNVTADQASQISQAVKAVALAQGKISGRNEFGATYGEMYRKFGITSYKLLPASRFEEAMTFLTNWHQDLTGDAPF